MRINKTKTIMVALAVALATAGAMTGLAAAPEKRLFMDQHTFGPGKVRAEDVAGAHQKDLAVQRKHGVRFLKYWFSEATGTVNCLVEAATAEDVLAAHKEAHGLMPERIEEVKEGR